MVVYRGLSRLALASVCSIVAGSASAVIVDISSAKDNTLYQSNSGLNLSNGGGVVMFTGRTGSNEARRAVIAFDVAAAIPTGATINSVSLRLYRPLTDDAATVDVRRLNQDWGEGTTVAPMGGGSGGPAAIGDVTWNFNFYNTSSWSTPGGSFSATPSASTATGTAPGLCIWSSAQLVADVQSMLNSPASNFGWVLTSSTEGIVGAAQRFSTKEASANQPILRVDYSVVPEPATLAALGVGLAFLARRRSRA